MSTVASTEPRILGVRVTKDEIIARLFDGRVISVPLAWSWRLSEATAAQRAHLRIIGSGQGVHWPDVDEDISAESMLHGVPAPRPKDRDVAVPSEAKRHGPANKSMQPARVKGRANGGRRHARG